MSKITHLNWTQFCDQFEPIKNTFVKDAPCDGFLFQAELLRDVPRVRTWSLIDNNDGSEMFITNGHRMINCLGYIVSRIEWSPEETIEVRLAESDIKQEDNGENQS